MEKHVALILAAGKGTRMHSDTPKVLQTVLGEPMLGYVLAALQPLFAANIWTVIGHNSSMVQERFVNEHMQYVLQKEQLGTGHALMLAMGQLQEANATHVLVINGDTPLITTQIIEQFLQKAQGYDVAFATLELPCAGAYGRVVREGGVVQAIVEAKDYDCAIHGPEPKEVNAGVYFLRMETVQELIPHLNKSNKSDEYYITDIVALAKARGYGVEGICCGTTAELFGVNSPLELAHSEEILRARMVQEALCAGVIIHGGQGVCISPRAQLAQGAEIFGPCHILGQSKVASGAVVHAYCYIQDSTIDSGAKLLPYSHLEGAHVGKNAVVGPYARLRPLAVLGEKSKVGNFVEVKKATLGVGAKVNHLSYIGDASVGQDANVGAGTITCNYDGVNKYTTTIGDGAFIGSNTSLVAPVNIGEGALVGAGSVITKDVPQGQMGIGRAKQSVLPRMKKK